jgi:hypothetical protein
MGLVIIFLYIIHIKIIIYYKYICWKYYILLQKIIYNYQIFALTCKLILFIRAYAFLPYIYSIKILFNYQLFIYPRPSIFEREFTVDCVRTKKLAIIILCMYVSAICRYLFICHVENC